MNYKSLENRYNTLDPKLVDGVYEIKWARYAKNKVALHFITDGSGYKTAAVFLFDVLFAGKRWTANRFYSNREGAYIISMAMAEKFVAAYKEK